MKRISFLFAAAFIGAASALVPWSEELWLDGGDYWRERLVLTFENPTDSVWTGRTVAVDAELLGLRENPLRELRFTDATGRHFRFDRKGKVEVLSAEIPDTEPTTHGRIALPDRANGSGPLYCALIGKKAG